MDKDNGLSWISDIIRCDGNNGIIKKSYVTPQILEDDNKYIEKINQWLTELEKQFDSLKADTTYTDVIKEFKEKLSNIFDAYLKGDFGKAYTITTQLVKPFVCNSKGLGVSSVQNSIAFNDIEKVLDNQVPKLQIEFFRARKSNQYTVYKSSDMLHVPFDKRKNISSARFSVPGLPCLYLGTSSYCCWLELRTPADYQFNVSPVLIDQELKVLNLTVTANIFEHIISLIGCDKKANEQTVEALKIWILTYVTSFKIEQDNRSFKIEYVLSQLIMLASKECGLAGVSYLSKQVEDDRFANMITVNLALFAEYNNEKKLSKIFNDVRIAPSFNFAMFKQLEAGEKYKCQSMQLHSLNTKYPKNIGTFSRQHAYVSTEFCAFDKYLFKCIEPEMKRVDIDKENSISP